ncbi:MAG TPA: DUF3293 domain-containing protein [Gemmatimonadaceae bacterium]|nr:DUF3293 domain-containing protein [Gemmatimonadaceae bacterium]
MSESKRPINAQWGSYPETVCYFQGDEEVMVDLREVVPSATRKGLAAVGLGEPFGILTAYNPRGVESDESENSRRAAELEAELHSLGLRFVTVDCCSPDRSHCECSVAVVAPRERVIDMAKRWEQIAIFWFDGAVFWIYGAITPGVLRLPVQDA